MKIPRNDMEHPASYSFSKGEADQLRIAYEILGREFLINLEIAWDFETDFGAYHDVTEDERKVGFSLMSLSKAQIVEHVFRGETYVPEKYWKCGDSVKLTGLIFSILEGVKLTPPLLKVDGKLNCLFPRSGNHRFSLGAINNSEPLPILVLSNQVDAFNQVVSHPVQD